MKGYWGVLLVASMILLMMPLVMVSPVEKAVQTAPQSVKVKHSEGEEETSISLYDMTLYETACKIPSDVPDEAIKAQLIAEYTLLLYQSNTSGVVVSTSLPFPSSYTSEYWKTVWGTEYEQRYSRLCVLLDEVYGRTIQYNGQPIMAVSHIMNSGQTENGNVLLGESVPYLVSVASPSDALSPDQLSTVTVSTKDMAHYIQMLNGKASTEPPERWISESVKTAAGTVETIMIDGVKIKGWDVANALGLPSASFEAVVENGQFVFTVHGKGHFVGMSVNGAIAMANDGQSYENILRHYYSGVSVV